jgi:hypothetical protein
VEAYWDGRTWTREWERRDAAPTTEGERSIRDHSEVVGVLPRHAPSCPTCSIGHGRETSGDDIVDTNTHADDDTDVGGGAAATTATNRSVDTPEEGKRRDPRFQTHELDAGRRLGP